MAEPTAIVRGDWVVIPIRFSESVRHMIPEIRGIVRHVRPEVDEIEVVEFRTHSTRTARLGKAKIMRGRNKSIERHMKEIADIPIFRSPGNRDLTTEGARLAPLGEVAMERYIANLRTRRNEQMATKRSNGKNGKNGNSKSETKAPKRGGKVSLSGVQAEDFFVTNAKDKSVFRPGWDAKFAGCLKRLAGGTADADDKRIAKSAKILNHPKVAESEHFQHLLGEVSKATA